jgi:hypothetical protein
MYQFLILQHLPFGGFEYRLVPENTEPPAYYYLLIGGYLLYQIWVIEPYHPDIAGFVSDDGFRAAAITQPYLTYLPDVSDNGFLVPLGQLRNSFSFGIIEVPMREVI